MKIETVPSSDFTARAIQHLVEQFRQRESGEPYHVFLSGGSTPKPIYAGLALAGIDWTNIHLWWGDERYVPLDHPESNYRMVKESLLDPLDFATDRVHPWPILASPERSAETYDLEFRSTFERDGQRLNLQILGMGDDGHTASLFPGSPALEERQAMCISNVAPGQATTRLTLTFDALAKSENVVFLLKGANKATTLKEVIQDGLHPSSQVRGTHSTLFFVDEAAAAEL